MYSDPTKDISWILKVYLGCNGCMHISRSEDVHEIIWKEVKEVLKPGQTLVCMKVSMFIDL